MFSFFAAKLGHFISNVFIYMRQSYTQGFVIESKNFAQKYLIEKYLHHMYKIDLPLLVQRKR